MTTNYLCNEWLDDSDKKLFESMKKNNPRRYAVAGLGNWGIVDGLVYENWTERAFTLDEIKQCKTRSGLDFGYTNDPTAFFVGFLDLDAKKLYVWDEFYEKGMSNKAINDKILAMGYSKERITGDSAEPKSIDELKSMKLRIKGAKKGKRQCDEWCPVDSRLRNHHSPAMYELYYRDFELYMGNRQVRKQIEQAD